MIVNGAIQQVVLLLQSLNWEIAVGTGTTPAWTDNLTLENEYDRADATVTLETISISNDALVFEASFTFGENVSISEYGVFKKAPDGWMFDRIVFDPVEIPAGQEFIFRIKIPIGK